MRLAALSAVQVATCEDVLELLEGLSRVLLREGSRLADDGPDGLAAPMLAIAADCVDLAERIRKIGEQEL